MQILTMSSIKPLGCTQAAGILLVLCFLIIGCNSYAETLQTPGDYLSLVNPELRPIAEKMNSFSRPAFSLENLPAIRKRTFFDRPLLKDISVREEKIPGNNSAPEITLYVVNAAKEGARPAILHMHGGGYVTGSAKDFVPGLQELAKALDCVIVTVDYRLAPETNYAGSIEDNYSGLHWLYTHADSLGVDPARIAVMGDSAGGGHAALLAITARDRGEVPVLFQMLIYPMLDDRTGSSQSVSPHVGQLIWKPEDNRFGWRAFLGQAPGTSTVPVKAVPARVENLAGLPPTFIGVGSIDLFVQEDIAYAQRLINAGISTELIIVPGAFHGFDGIASDSDISSQFNQAKIAALTRAFAAE